MLSWNEICNRADGKAHLSPELKAKDEARWRVGRLMVENGEPDPENDEIPEESIERYCDRFCIRFNESGNIAGYELPETIAEAVYRQRDDEYLKQDIMHELEERKDFPEVSEEMIYRMMQEYRHIADCNVPYNSSIETAVDNILKGAGNGESN